MEAVATGCPYVVGDVMGLADLIGKTSPFRVDPADRTALVNAVLTRLRDPAGAMADAALVRQRAVDKVDWDSVAKRYGDLLADCIGAGHR
jgi:glycosyltransferase involved in cell wall biosynthesis